MDDEEHEYELIDEYLPPGEPWEKPHSLIRAYSEEAGRYSESQQVTLPKNTGADLFNRSTSSSSLQFSCSLPKEQNMAKYQMYKVPITISSEPTTPATTPNRNNPTLQRSKTLQEFRTPPIVDRSTKPPSLPPKPSTVVHERKDPVVISKTYTLSDFCACEPMPKMVRVSGGYYGETERTSISEGEEFVFYLLKTVLAIPARPVRSISSSEIFHIPINSLLKIAVIDKHSDSTHNYVYPSLNHLMHNRYECPRVVCVTKDHHFIMANRTEVLPAGTLLFLDEKPTKKSGRYFIHCRTLKNQKYDLPMDSNCNLTTHPADTQIYITDYLTMVNKFPVNIQLFHGDCEEIYEEPKEVASSIGMSLTLNRPIKQKSIIAKTDLEGTRKDNPITVEIPFDLPIEIEAIERPEEDMEQIYSEVLDLYENFNPESIEKSYAMYSSFQKEINRTVSHHQYEKMDIAYELECPNTDYEPLQKVLAERELFLSKQQANGNSTDDDIRKLKEENKKLQEEIEMLRRKKRDGYTMLVKPSKNDSGPSAENLKELRNMDVMDISQLLKNMGLSQYVERFKTQHIDGELLATLEGSELSTLVDSPIHVKRLMLIATGQSSIKKYFDPENPYATTVRKV